VAERSEKPELPGWIADHMRRYIDSNGADGHIWNGVPTLLLTMKGRRSGEPITLPLIYGEDNGRYLLVASKGGHTNHPVWYLNLVAEPSVKLQVGADKFRARARTSTGAERAALWKKMIKIWPAYDEYQAKTQREIPVVVLERQ
jgi:deazaflavin-dependent oxidoreductase (nitroreductase family)